MGIEVRHRLRPHLVDLRMASFGIVASFQGGNVPKTKSRFGQIKYQISICTLHLPETLPEMLLDLSSTQ
jgi:hypothetical protein